MQEPTQPPIQDHQTGIIAWTETTASVPFENPALTTSTPSQLQPPSTETTPSTSPHHQHHPHHQLQQHHQEQQQPAHQQPPAHQLHQHSQHHFLQQPVTPHSFQQHSPRPSHHHQDQHQQHHHQHQPQPHHHQPILPPHNIQTINDGNSSSGGIINNNSNNLHVEEETKAFPFVIQPSTPFHHQQHHQVPKSEGVVHHFEYANEHHHHTTTMTQNDLRTELPEGGGDRRGDSEGVGGGVEGKVVMGQLEEEGFKRGRKRHSEDENSYQVGGKITASHRCDVCGEQASGHYFGALVCLPCKSFFIRCTKDGPPNFSGQCGGKCDVLKGGRVRCQHCRFQKCINAGMYRKEKPEAVEPAEGQMLCKVCGDIANGVHFGVTTCEGCKKFFRRGLKENRTYSCKGDKLCSINPRMRNNCRYCRYQKCLYEGMSREAIKMGRPKKGEIIYRNNKTPMIRKNGYNKQPPRQGERTPSSYSNHSSNNEDYGNELSDHEVYDQLSTTPQAAHNHHQINDHIQHNLQQQHQQQHQQQQHINQQQQQQQHDEHNNVHHAHQNQPAQGQATGFSLGTLLHDCMTVDDWDGSGHVMTSSDQGSHGMSSNAAGEIIVAQSDNRGLDSTAIRHSISPRQRLTSPGASLASDNNNPVINLQQAHQHHQQQQQQLQQQQQSRHFYNDNVHHHPYNSDVKPMSAHRVDLSHIQQQQQQQQQHHSQQPEAHTSSQHNNNLMVFQDTRRSDLKQNFAGEDGIPVFDYLENEESISQNRIVKVEKGGIIDCDTDEPFPNNVNMDEIQNFHTLTKVNLHHYNHPQPSPSPYAGSNSHTPPIGEMVIPVSQLEPSVNSQIIVYSSNNQVVNSDPNIVSHPNITLKRSPPRFQNNFDNSELGNVAPVQSEVVNLSQNQSIVSSLHNSASPIGSDNLVASVSHPVINGTDMLVMRNSNNHNNNHINNNVNVSLANSVLKNFVNRNNNNNNNSNNNNNNNTIINTHINVSTPQNNIISQAMAIANEESSDNSIESYLNSERKSQSMTNLQNLDKTDNMSQLRDFEELLRTKFGTKLTKQQIQSQSLDYLRLKKQMNSGNNISKINKGIDFLTAAAANVSNQGVVRSEPNTPPNTTIPNFLEHRSNYSSTGVKKITITTSIINNKAHAGNNNNNIITDPHKYQQQNTEHNSGGFNENDALDSIELHETNRVYMAIDNTCGTNGCYRRDPKCKSPFDDPAIMTKLSAVDFLPEISHSYWHRFQPKSCQLTLERQRTIDDIYKAFGNLHTTYMSSETDCPKPHCSNSLEFWHYIQQTIARHVVAGQQFCKNIPDYLKLDIQDRISLGKHVGFGLMVLIACTEFYDPVAKDLKKDWTCKMPVHGALLRYREYLLSLGDKMNIMGVDRAETALLCAISMTSIDCPGLVKPDTVSEVQSVLIDSLESYIIAKGHSGGRLQTLLGLMPQVRLMTVWYNNLMKKMSLPCDILNKRLCKKNGLKPAGRIMTQS